MKILFIIASVIVMYGCVQIIAYSLKQASNEWKEIKKLLWLVVTANVALTTTIIKNTVDEVIELMKMEGLEHKLTPFQETVNTYIKNRGEEIKQILSDITTKE